MKLTTLHLINYRGIEDLVVPLDSRLNVFIGPNGAGKSAILDSAAIMLDCVVKQISSPKCSSPQIPQKDISNGKDFAEIKGTAVNKDASITWVLHEFCTNKIHHGRANNFTELEKYIKSAKKQDSTGLTLFAYYSAARFVLSKSFKTSTRNMLDPLSAYDGALDYEKGFFEFAEHFQEDAPPAQLFAEFRQIKTIRSAIQQFNTGISSIRVCRSPLRLEVIKGHQNLTSDQLSAGEKSLTAMVSDLAYRLAVLNPNHPNPLLTDGIILIDEIELHLCPQWQHSILPALLNTFPNCQFLIATNSPHIITHTQPECVHILDRTDNDIEVRTTSESYGKTPEAILSQLMEMHNTRPDEIHKLIYCIYDDIDSGALNDAKQKLKLLEQMTNNGFDPEITRIRLIIRREERRMK